MSIRTSSLVFAIAVVSLGSVVLSQSAHLIPDISKESPIFGHAATYDLLTGAEIQGLDRTVSARFENAKIGDVLKWLSKEKVNFVAQTGQFTDVRLTLSFNNVKLSEVLDSIAGSLNAHWERKGDVFTLKASGDLRTAKVRNIEGMPFAIAPRAPSAREGQRNAETRSIAPRYSRSEPRVKIDVTSPEEEFGHSFSWSSEPDGSLKAFRWNPKKGEMEPMTQDELKKLEREWEKWAQEYGKNFEKWGEAHGKHWEQWGEEFGKNFEKWGKEFELKWKSDEKSQRAFEEAMKAWEEKHSKDWEAWSKNLEEELKKEFQGLENKDREKMTPEERARFDAGMKKLQERLKSMPHFKDFKMFDGPLSFSFEAMPPLSFSLDAMPPLPPLEGLEKLKPMEIPRSSRIMPPTTLRSGTIDELLRSLTPMQIEKQSKQGYLLFTDLTKEQQKMLGVSGHGEFSISVSKDGKKVVVKSKP